MYWLIIASHMNLLIFITTGPCLWPDLKIIMLSSRYCPRCCRSSSLRVTLLIGKFSSLCSHPIPTTPTLLCQLWDIPWHAHGSLFWQSMATSTNPLYTRLSWDWLRTHCFVTIWLYLGYRIFQFCTCQRHKLCRVILTIMLWINRLLIGLVIRLYFM